MARGALRDHGAIALAGGARLLVATVTELEPPPTQHLELVDPERRAAG